MEPWSGWPVGETMRLLIAASFVFAVAACGDDGRMSNAETVSQNNAINVPGAIDQPPAAPAPVQPYKAVGTEPGWALSIGPTGMTYQGDYGSVVITEPAPPAFRPAPGSYAGTRLKLTIAPGPCSDGMSDLIYRHTVRLVADGKTVSGCGGGTIAPDSLAGTSWTVTAINGRAVPGGARYFVNFDDNRVSASFGCNSFGGPFRLNGDHLSTSDLHVTEMACGEPAMTHERQGGAVLASNMRIERPSGTAMRLVSEAGTIDLKRSI